MGGFVEKVPISGVEDLVECTREADIEVSQTKRGRVTGEISQIDLGDGLISTGSFRGSVRVRGVMANDGIVLGTLLSADGPTFEWGKQVRSGDVGHYLGGHECDSIHNGSLSYILLTLSTDTFVRAVSGRELNLPSKFWKDPRFSMTQTQRSRALHDFLLSARAALDRPEIVSSDAIRSAVLGECLDLFLDAMGATEDRNAGSVHLSPSHYSAVRIAEDYLRSESEDSVQLSDLSDRTGFSQASLNRAFKHVLDVSPIVYLRRWRLSQVRRCLSEEAGSGVSVTAAALRFGFWELGRFSQQYNELFGELPSTTLKRSLRGPRIQRQSRTAALPSA